jgi:ABC-type protease/lipase transport system fused ATPase/permease subunit
VLKRPAILVLDEATSALDSLTERMVQDSLTAIRGRCTQLIVAHRLSTVMDADCIIVLERGQVGAAAAAAVAVAAVAAAAAAAVAVAAVAVATAAAAAAAAVAVEGRTQAVCNAVVVVLCLPACLPASGFHACLRV